MSDTTKHDARRRLVDIVRVGAVTLPDDVAARNAIRDNPEAAVAADLAEGEASVSELVALAQSRAV